MKTKTLIALMIAIVAFSACQKEETPIPENHIRITFKGGYGEATVFNGETKHRLNMVHKVVEFKLPTEQSFTYRNHAGNAMLLVYVNGDLQEPVIRLIDGDTVEHEYKIKEAKQ